MPMLPSYFIGAPHLELHLTRLLSNRMLCTSMTSARDIKPYPERQYYFLKAYGDPLHAAEQKKVSVSDHTRRPPSPPRVGLARARVAGVSTAL